MNLEYRVLWFEDQFDAIRGDVRRLTSLIEEYGFIPQFTHKDKISEDEIDQLASDLSNNNPFDLIIFDYDLGSNSVDGDVIASNLRNKIYTDMVFYSGQIPQQLRQNLYEKEVDGVFIVHRNTFYDDIEPIIEDHIKKMSDLNNIRGVVMAATSQIDVNLREGLIEKLKTLDDGKLNSIINKTKTRLHKNIAQRAQKIDGIKCIESLTNIIEDHSVIDFNRVRLTYVSACNKGDVIRLAIDDNSHLKKAIDERNRLAHQNAVIEDGKMTLKSDNGDQQYDQQTFIDVRKLLLSATADVETC